MSERIIISGEPGTRWTNTTEKVQYQFIAALINTCGVCLQYHLKIGPMWPIPIHWGCRCIQRLLKPGQQAQHPFVDYRKLLDDMPREEKRAAIGASNYKLLKSGLATWEDIVTPSRVRDFREVVAKKGLTVDQMVKRGVNRIQAEKAYSAVHTAEHEHAERQRRELLQKLTGAGLSHDNLVRELSNRLAGRVTIAPGPTGPYTEGPAWGGGPLPIPGGAAELAGLISGWRPSKQKAAMPPKPKAPPAPQPVKPPEPSPTEQTATEPIREPEGPYRSFANWEQGEKWGQEAYAKWAKSLTQSEKNAISDYTGNDWYSPLNRWLRNDRGPTEDMRGRTVTELESMAKTLDKALARQPLQENLVVHRVIDFTRGGKSAPDFTPGKFIEDKGFSSTTLNPDPKFRGTVLEIKLPKGAHAAYLNTLGTELIPTKTERELLVGRNVNRYRIVSVTKGRPGTGESDIVHVEGILSE